MSSFRRTRSPNPAAKPRTLTLLLPYEPGVFAPCRYVSKAGSQRCEQEFRKPMCKLCGGYNSICHPKWQKATTWRMSGHQYSTSCLPPPVATLSVWKRRVFIFLLFGYNATINYELSMILWFLLAGNLFQKENPQTAKQTQYFQQKNIIGFKIGLRFLFTTRTTMSTMSGPES